MKHFFSTTFAFFFCMGICQPLAAYEKPLPEEPLLFSESWAYVISGLETEVSDEALESVTDLCFFSADINCYGEISSIPSTKKFSDFKGRKHLVITCEGRSLSHFVLDQDYGVTKKLIRSIKKASKDFDGVQIDFETIPMRDLNNFRKFLTKLKKAAGSKKIFSVCVPARNKKISDDIFDYSDISKIADKVFIMAYDQHWSTSAAGPVADLDWCSRVADYAKTTIPEDKLILGLPFYGRTWANTNLAKAWYNSGINRIINENKVSNIKRDVFSKILSFKFKTDVEITGYFDDAVSLYEKMKAYDSLGINKIGFWRLGHEDPDFWKLLKVDQTYN